MNDLNRALNDITTIRRQVARATEFRGYGPATLAATSVFAILGAVVQTLVLTTPADHILVYLEIWISTAIVSASLIAVQTVTRAHRMHSGMADEMLRTAVEQFLPAAAAGALLTFVLVRFAPSSLWMLPGLWQLTFGLGVFASCRFLPRPMVAAGVWYLLTGLACISLADSRALSPWSMGIAYGGGQLLVAGVLYFASSEDHSENPL
jgi:hypothetical protein